MISRKYELPFDKLLDKCVKDIDRLKNIYPNLKNVSILDVASTKVNLTEIDDFIKSLEE